MGQFISYWSLSTKTKTKKKQTKPKAKIIVMIITIQREKDGRALISICRFHGAVAVIFAFWKDSELIGTRHQRQPRSSLLCFPLFSSFLFSKWNYMKWILLLVLLCQEKSVCDDINLCISVLLESSSSLRVCIRAMMTQICDRSIKFKNVLFINN